METTYSQGEAQLLLKPSRERLWEHCIANSFLHRKKTSSVPSRPHHFISVDQNRREPSIKILCLTFNRGTEHATNSYAQCIIHAGKQSSCKNQQQQQREEEKLS
jgi:hypothetical protein